MPRIGNLNGSPLLPKHGHIHLSEFNGQIDQSGYARLGFLDIIWNQKTTLEQVSIPRSTLGGIKPWTSPVELLFRKPRSVLTDALRGILCSLSTFVESYSEFFTADSLLSGTDEDADAENDILTSLLQNGDSVRAGLDVAVPLFCNTGSQ